MTRAHSQETPRQAPGLIRTVVQAAIRCIPMVAVTLWLAATPAQASILTGSLMGSSTLTPTGTPGVFTQDFAGTGIDSLLGPFTVDTHSTIDFSSPPALIFSAGSITQHFPFGTIIGTTTGSGMVTSPGHASFTIDFVLTKSEGSLHFTGGEGTITGTITLTSPTTATSDASYTINATPEPATWGLLLGGAGLLAFLRRKRA